MWFITQPLNYLSFSIPWLSFHSLTHGNNDIYLWKFSAIVFIKFYILSYSWSPCASLKKTITMCINILFVEQSPKCLQYEFWFSWIITFSKQLQVAVFNFVLWFLCIFIFRFCCIVVAQEVYKKWLFIISFSKQLLGGMSSIWHYSLFLLFFTFNLLAIHWFLWHYRNLSYF